MLKPQDLNLNLKKTQDSCCISSKIQLYEILNDPNIEKQLEAIPQESSNLQIALRQTGVFDVLMNAIKRRFPRAHLAEDPIVKGHSLDIVITDTKRELPLKLNIELDGPHHQSAFQQSKDRLRDQILAQNGWSILRILNSDLIEKEPDEQIGFLLPHIESILPTWFFFYIV